MRVKYNIFKGDLCWGVVVFLCLLVLCASAEEKAEVLKTPDYVAFSEKGAARLDAMGRRRPVVYAYLADYLIDRFDLSKREGVGIDIGGGTGDLGVEIVKRTEKLYWINTDINSWCSRYFTQRLLDAKASHRASFVFADAGALPFKDGYADLVVSRGSYQFWGSLEGGISEIHRVLKKGGEAYIGRGLSRNMPEKMARDLFKRRIIGGPKYDPDEDAKRFRIIMKKMGIKKFEIIRHKPSDSELNYGVWLYFQRS